MGDPLHPLRRIDLAQLERYAAHECDDQERSDVVRQLAEHPAAAQVLDAIRYRLSVTGGLEASAWDATEGLAELHSAMAAKTGEGPAVPPTSARGRLWLGKQSLHLRFPVYLIAAICAAVVVWMATRATPSPSHSTEYATTVGQQLVITLPDSSRVRLTSGSHLRTLAGFNQSHRTIELRGEALFDVRAANGSPFVVRTGSVTTTVLGTMFAVRARDDAAVDVHVGSGRVRIGTGHASVVATAGEMARATDSTTVLVAEHASKRYADWARGQLVFKGVSVPELLAVLGQWYGYEFHLDDSVLTHRNVSMSFTIGDELEMMALLKYVLEVDMRFDGKTVTLIRHEERRASPKIPLGHQPFTPSVEMGK